MNPSADGLAERIASRLAEIEGISAIALGGSRAQGIERPDSDFDIGVYYHADRTPLLADLRQAAEDSAGTGSGAAVTEFGGWGPWIDGGAWLEIEGRRVDWIYREIGRMRSVIEACRRGETGFHYQAGHPFAFCDHIYLAELHYCRPLHDPEAEIVALKSMTNPYPPALRRRLIATFPEATFTLDIARKAAARGDSYYVAGCLFRCVSILAQVIFALNERYWINEKGVIAIAASLPLCPEGFASTARDVLAQPGRDPETLEQSVMRLQSLVQSVSMLIDDAGT